VFWWDKEAGQQRSRSIKRLRGDLGRTKSEQVLRRSHGGDRPVPGLRIQLRSSDGAFVAVLPVFADGTFYHLGLAPGRYHAEVDAAQLDFLGVRSEPLAREFTVRATREGDFLEGIDFLLVPAHDPPIQTGREVGR
jgi:hypothetical protein